LAFLGRKLGDLLNTPFPDLAGTPGIGQKKMRSLVRLLARVANTDPNELPVDMESPAGNGRREASTGSTQNGFAPNTVSESVWDKWRSTVIRLGLGSTTLGRLSPSLKRMTRVIWNTPLSDYTGLSLTQLRAMKTHGEKRVQAILEVFYCVQELLDGMKPQPHLTVRLVPCRVDAVERWVWRALQTPGVPGRTEVRATFVEPLMEQIRTDATQQILRLAENRIGIGGPITSVRQCARDMGLTRARVYQLLNEINDILSVRWPMGRHQVYGLLAKFEAESAEMADPPDLSQFRAAVELFYPGSRRGAAGPLERTAPPEDDVDPTRPGNSDDRSDAELLEIAG
jgi:hypothetical protein